MLLFHILAALWHQPGTAAEIAGVLQAHDEAAFPAQAVEHHAAILHGCGYLCAGGDPAAPVYSLTTEGSALLARLAQALERPEALTA